jgi:hypothetical protein
LLAGELADAEGSGVRQQTADHASFDGAGISDAHGEVVGYVDLDGAGYGVFEQIEPASEVTTYSDAEMAQRNARALGLYAAFATERKSTAARRVWKYNQVLAYVQ